MKQFIKHNFLVNVLLTIYVSLIQKHIKWKNIVLKTTLDILKPSSNFLVVI